VHELSICTAIAGIASRHASGRPVARVCVDVGRLRQVVPDTLVACWELAVTQTALEGAALDVTHVAAAITCRACGQRTVLEHPVFRCSACSGTDVVVASGDELTVTSLVLQEA
jgi:hydrogenase nickel incorporation protein HypA/HybF